MIWDFFFLLAAFALGAIISVPITRYMDEIL